MVKEILNMIIFLFVFAEVVSIPLGLVNGARGDCPGESLATRYNPTYRICCELTKPRFK